MPNYNVLIETDRNNGKKTTYTREDTSFFNFFPATINYKYTDENHIPRTITIDELAKSGKDIKDINERQIVKSELRLITGGKRKTTKRRKNKRRSRKTRRHSKRRR